MMIRKSSARIRRLYGMRAEQVKGSFVIKNGLYHGGAA